MMFKVKKLHEAIRQDDAAQVTNIFAQMPTEQRRRKLYDACVMAIEQKASKALYALLRPSGFDFPVKFGQNQDRKLATQLVTKTLSSSDSIPLLSTLYDANKTATYGQLDKRVFLNDTTSVEFINSYLKNNPAEFDVFLKSLLNSTEKVKIVLDCISTIHNHQPALNSALVQAAEAGNLEVAKILIERKANPNASGGKALLQAAECGKADMVDFLLPLTKAELCKEIATCLQQKESAPQEDILSKIESAGSTANSPKNTTAQPQQAAAPITEGLSRVNDNTLLETHTLPDGSQLMSIFNFRSKQQKNIFRDATSDHPYAPETVNFDQIAPEVIADMRAELDELNRKQTTAKSPTLKKIL